MSESRKIVLHMNRLAEHVRRRLQTTDVYKWLLTGNWPNVDAYDADVREALTKLQRLEHRYDQLWRKRSGVLRTVSVPDSQGGITIYEYCCDEERKWVNRMWRKGDWAVYRKDKPGLTLRLEGFEGGRFRGRVIQDAR